LTSGASDHRPVVVEIGIPANIWSVDDDGGADFTRIQDAIKNASAGDTIIVCNGTYPENIDVAKSLTIKSSSGYPGDTTVQAVTPEDPIFNVTADYVTISGFTVKGADTGIDIYKADCCNISNNNCSSNNVYGIDLRHSSNNSIFNNTCSNNDFGIYLYNSSNNCIKDNNVSNNGLVISSGIFTVIWGNGIYLFNSSNNKIYLNNFINNSGNVYSLN
jgi:nitrous oxidase accessory protein